MTPYSTGTWGSRCMVMAGGAVAVACREIAKRAAKIGAQLLQADAAQVTVRAGEVAGPRGSIIAARDRADLVPASRKTCRTMSTWAAWKRPSAIAPIPTPELSATPRMRPSSRSIRRSGDVEILDYVVVEDGGKLVNPMVVDGQILGGIAQGIGTALYEEMPFDASAQPLASTLADYLLPGSTDVPATRIEHMETLAPLHRVWRQRHRRGRRHRCRRPRSPTPSMMRCGRYAPNSLFRQSRRIGYLRQSSAAAQA